MKKAAIYVRVSTNYQIDKDSLPLQRQEMINYSKYALNIDEYEIFEDAGFSGKNTLRPAFQEMIKRIKLGEFSHLLVWKIDRISRNLMDFCTMYEELKSYNCTFISKNEQFDTSTPMGEAMLKIILVFAELERKLTGERVTAVMIDRGKKGLWNGAPVPLGYKWNENSKFPIIDEAESETVKMIYSFYLEFKSTSVVRNKLNELSIKTKRGGSWTTKTIGDILRNPFYKGTYRYNFKEGGRGKKKKENEWIIVDDNHPNIINKDIWIECNRILDINAQRCTAAFRATTKDHVFSGLISCGECGKNYHGKENPPTKDGFKPSFYVCSGRYNHSGCSQKSINDNIVGNFILNLIKNFENINFDTKAKDIEDILLTGTPFKDVKNIDKASIESIKDILSVLDPNILNISTKKNLNIPAIKPFEKEISKLERALKRLEDLYLFDEDAISEKDYILRKKEITEKIKDINKNATTMNKNTPDTEVIKRVHTIVVTLELQKNSEIDYKYFIRKIQKKYLKEIINEVIHEIIVKDRRIISVTFKNSLKITFNY